MASAGGIVAACGYDVISADIIRPGAKRNVMCETHVIISAKVLGSATEANATADKRLSINNKQYKFTTRRTIT